MYGDNSSNVILYSNGMISSIYYYKINSYYVLTVFIPVTVTAVTVRVSIHEALCIRLGEPYI